MQLDERQRVDPSGAPGHRACLDQNAFVTVNFPGLTWLVGHARRSGPEGPVAVGR